MTKHFLVFSLLATAIGAGLWASAQDRQAVRPSSVTAAAPTLSAGAAKAPVPDDGAERIEGEKRFKANCGRCHLAPEKFPPRMMTTILRHMRVRATLTEEDTRLILHYMTQ